MEKIGALFAENKFIMAMGVMGLLLMGFGLTKMMQENQGSDLVIEANPSQLTQGSSSAGIVVDVQGAVGKPGVYHLANGARVAEALVAAGGLAETADSVWVAKMVNQAELARDGQKIYIPVKNDPASAEASAGKQISNTSSGNVAGAATVNVNNASTAELDGLWGIGAVRAQAIVDNRPYATIQELVTKAKIPQDVLDKNEGKISVY